MKLEAPAPRQCLGQREPSDLGPGGRRTQIERNHSHSAVLGIVRHSWAVGNDRRRLPENDCQADHGRGWRLCVRGEENQPHLLDDIQGAMRRPWITARKDSSATRMKPRRESRPERNPIVLILTNPETIRNRTEWEALRSSACTRALDRCMGSGATKRITSSAVAVPRRSGYGKAIRGHWGIENNLHWQLDITFGEDANRVQRRHGAENLAPLCRLA